MKFSWYLKLIETNFFLTIGGHLSFLSKKKKKEKQPVSKLLHTETFMIDLKPTSKNIKLINLK